MLTLKAIKDPRVALTTEGMTNYQGVDMDNPTSSRVNYEAYIASDAWKAKKDEWIANGGPRYCFVCEKPLYNPEIGVDSRRGFNFHHRTYENLGNEKMLDLVLLCREHHEDLEKQFKEHKHYVPLYDWTYMYICLERNELGKMPLQDTIFAKHLPMGEFND